MKFKLLALYATLFLSLFLIVSTTRGQQPVFNIKYSEHLAVYMFVKQLGANYGDNPFKTSFKNSKYHTPRYLELIARLDSIKTYYSYEFNDFPYGSKVPGVVENLLRKNLIAAHSWQDFKSRSVGLITNADLIQLTHILTEFTPVYKELIYLPNQQKFESQLANISNFVKTKNITSFFEEGMKFYNTFWDTSIPFEMVFYPLPDSDGFMAEAFYNNSVCPIATNLEDYNLLLSIMLHEIFHILYNEQSLKTKLDIDYYFNNHPSAHSQYAYLLLNEILATGLANGYVYAQLNGKEDAEDWYFFPYINLMAKKMYPTIVSYVKEKNQ